MSRSCKSRDKWCASLGAERSKIYCCLSAVKPNPMFIAVVLRSISWLQKPTNQPPAGPKRLPCSTSDAVKQRVLRWCFLLKMPGSLILFWRLSSQLWNELSEKLNIVHKNASGLSVGRLLPKAVHLIKTRTIRPLLMTCVAYLRSQTFTCNESWITDHNA